MATLRIKRGGKITLPKEMLDHLGIPSGGLLDVSLLANHQLELEAAAQSPTDAAKGKSTRDRDRSA